MDTYGYFYAARFGPGHLDTLHTAAPGLAGVAVTVVAAGLLVGNGIFLALLLLARQWLTGRGYFDPDDCDSLGDWRGKAL